LQFLQTNIHSKLQRHSVFESEIISNNERFIQVHYYHQLNKRYDNSIGYNVLFHSKIDREVELTCNAPSVLTNSKKDVYQQLDDLKAEWKHLNETMKSKKVRLEQACRCLSLPYLKKNQFLFNFRRKKLLSS